ncbi:MAG: hypothetical protein A2Y40_05960 [Candidatus Margulisbacteria bacterium GWF2_35_9]|nr:MAG: hypothetical protein A2Y40_05960 [Candidatus Margulisbacteria bacterium GWF2_35_9]
MLKNIIKYFTHRHMLSNMILIGILLGGVYFWNHTQKEELPNIAMDTLRISASYPGASPEEIEYFVTNPIEDAVKNLEGVSDVFSVANSGVTNITVELDVTPRERAEVINNIKSSVLNVKLPTEVRDEPTFREFKTSQKAVLDIFIYDEKAPFLSDANREIIQAYADSLETQLLNLKQVNSISKSGYLEREILVRVDPKKAQAHQLSFPDILAEIRKNNIRVPVGQLSDKEESKISIKAEMDTIDLLNELSIQGGFSSPLVKLKEIADISYSYKEAKTISKVNGRQAIQLNVVKAVDSGIIDSVDEIVKFVKKFNEMNLKNTSIKLITLDDESQSVRDRIALIVQNGLIGFVLIVALLMIFLDFKSGFWVAIGIPFTICFTLVFGSLAGFTINNITLAAIIVVMGMVVDDAIVVAENVSRMKASGEDPDSASVEGTHSVFLPIVASVTTTCLAFVPLLFFSGRMSRMIASLPIIITLMLSASLFESTLLLPGHLNLRFPWEKKINKPKKEARHWFYKVEEVYGRLIKKLLKRKLLILLAFILLLVGSVYIYKYNIKFTMFPNEETTEILINGEVGANATRLQTAEKVSELEDIFQTYLGKEVVGFRTSVASSFRGGAVQENKFSMNIELFPKDKRTKSVKQLLAEWKTKYDKLSGYKEISVRKSRFGQSSGSPIEIVILENNNKIRLDIANEVSNYLKNISALKNVEIESPIKIPEYTVSLKKDYLKRVGINPESIGTVMRSALEGTTIYTLLRDNKEIDVLLTTKLEYNNSIEKLLGIPVANNQNYLVPLRTLLTVDKQYVDSSINHEKQKRTSKVYADFKENGGKTPIEIADIVEKDLFPNILGKYPTSIIYFGGEVKDSREASADFLVGGLMVLSLIYFILALLFNSLSYPLVIMLSIPFGVIGVILAYYFHGYHLFGFFAVVGILGLSGVVVNDSIVMLTKLSREQDVHKRLLTDTEISDIAKTRLRAVILTTVTTVAGLFPTAYGIAGYDSMLSEMMFAMAWGLIFATVITLILIPTLFSGINSLKRIYLGVKS